MITEQYVSFDTAKMLKKAGFDYKVHKYFYRPRLSSKTMERFAMSPRNANEEARSISCPTQALAARWIRETHGFHVFAKRAYDYILSRHTWGFCIQRAKYDTVFSLEIGFDSYESALEAGLQEILQKIIKNKEQ